MKEYITDFLIGSVASSVPIYILTTNFFNKQLTVEEFDYPSMIINLPLKFGFINMIAFMLINKINPDWINNPIIIGSIMSIVYSLFGKCVNEIPKNLLKMENPNLFHLYAICIWIVVYMFLLKARSSLI